MPIPILVPSAVNRFRGHSTTRRIPGRCCRIPNPLNLLLLLRDPATSVIIFTIGIYYTIYSCLQASLSSLFIEIHDTSDLVSGLIYLPFGIACAIGAFATCLSPAAFCSIYHIQSTPTNGPPGKILDIDYRHTAEKHGITVDKTKDHSLNKFPIEEARLRSLKYSLVLCCLIIIGYGWSLKYNTVRI